MGCVSSHEKADGPLGLSSSLEQPRPLPNPYTPQDYAAFIHEALEHKSGEDAVRALQECTPEQCHDIAAHYDSLFSQPLLEAFQVQCQARTAFIALLLVRGVCEAAATYLIRLLDVMMPKPEITSVEIVCGLNESLLQQTLSCYTELTGCDLLDVIEEKCTPQVADILVSRLLQESADEDKSAEAWAAELVQAAAENNLFEGKKLFQTCIKTQTSGKLADIFDNFLKLCARDMSTEIQKYYPDGHIRDCYDTMATLFHNPSLHYARKIKRLLPDTFEDGHINLLYTVLSQSQKDVVRLKQTYQSTYFESLARDIREELPEPFMQRVLLKHIK